LVALSGATTNLKVIEAPAHGVGPEGGAPELPAELAPATASGFSLVEPPVSEPPQPTHCAMSHNANPEHLSQPLFI
jgi:hypothetical protein